MKLVRYGNPGAERPALLDSKGVLRDLSGTISDINGSSLLSDSLKTLRGLNSDDLPLVPDSPRIGPCVGSVGKFICIGLNYSDHAAESGMAVPVEPVVFMKATSAICGPNDNVTKPRNSQKMDWEVKLGVGHRKRGSVRRGK
jgi:2-keto-4-pentenoate hydratase/2-oxohepta-3-ene-1,7-dioic acid hydratase in catechol pathway